MLNVAPGIWQRTLEMLRTCGRGRRECVVFWLGPASQPALVNAAVHADHLSTAGYFEVDPTWLAHFWVELGNTARSVRAQIHTHPGPAFHSHTDDEGAIIQVPGFLSLVLPKFAMDDNCLDGAFLAWLDEAGRVRPIPIEKGLEFTDGRS